MRNSILSRPPLAGHSSQASNPNRARSPTFDDPTPIHHDAPTIRFISSTPANSSSSTRDAASFAASTSLAPRQGEPSRRRLVPKKSKLGLLATKTKERVNKDLSDIARRVGADTPSTGRGPYEIYVDHDEEEEGSIIVVKKKKSRMGLDGMGWGALGEVTNVPSVEDREEKGSTKVSKPKARKSMEVLLGRGVGDENQKWWNVSIGRGRKEVKEKKSTDTIQPRSKTPDPFQPSDTRSRFNSLDAGALLSGSDASDSTPKYVPRRKSSVATIFGLPERSKTPSAEQELSDNPGLAGSSDTTPTTSKHAARRKSSVASIFGLPERSKTPSAEQDLSENNNEPNASTTGSIALRAMRSVRSLAHMASWATMRSTSNSSTTTTNNNSDREGNRNHTRALSDVTTLNTNSSTTVTTRKTKGRSEEKEKEREKKKKRKEEKDRQGSRREKKAKDVEDGDKTPKQKKKRSLRLRTSASSFEGGSLTRQASMIMMPPTKVEETVKKKQSTLGLGIPTTMKLSAMRSSSSLSKERGAHPQKEKEKGKESHPPPVRNRFSSDSAHLIMGPNGRPASSISSGTSSSATSFRPASSLSGVSAFSMRSPRSSNGSVASVRWDEAGLQTVKEMQRRERERRRLSTEPPQNQTQSKAIRDLKDIDKEKESQRGSAAMGRRRATIADIFPEVRQQQAPLPPEPISPIEEVSIDSHRDEDADRSVMSTVKKARRRPLSDQMFGRPRPKAMSDDGDGVKSILDAATDELASLIDRLDLEATPKDSPRNNSPVKRTAITLGRSPSLGIPRESSPIRAPAKCTFNPETDAPLLETLSSRTPHATLRKGNALSPAASSIRQQVVDITDHRPLIGRQIAPWSTLDWEDSPKRPAHKLSAIFRPLQRRSRSPEPEESSVVFEPLVPAARKRVTQLESLPSTGTPVNMQTTGVPSSSTFGSGAQLTKIGKQPSTEFDDDEPTPPSPSPPSARRSRRHSRKSSVLSAMCDSGAILPPAAFKSLGLAGSSCTCDPDLEDEDPDSDIPDELQNILSNQSDDESINALDSILSSRHQSLARISAIPPLAALPLSQAYTDPDGTPVVPTALLQADDEDCDADIDDAVDQSPREDDTYKSFDFTGELQKLIHDSGETDRRSFVEQLENAFGTAAQLDLGFSLGSDMFAKGDFSRSCASSMHHNTPEKDLVAQDLSEHDVSASNISMDGPARSESDHDHSRSYCHSSHSDTLDHLIRECEEDICMQYPIAEYSSNSVRPKESDGKLNMNFKFGGRPSISDISFASSDKPLTLSDVIPPIIRLSPPSNSYGDDNSSILHSLYDHPIEDDRSSMRSTVPQAIEVSPRKQALLQQRPRLVSDASSKRLSQDLAQLASSMSSSFSHSKRNSEASFTGFEAFEEVRRGFEFHPNANRAAFFPPPGATSRSYQNRFSLYSVATSYGEAFNSGVVDPFGYASSRPTSSDMSMAMSTTVEDTFSFLKKAPQRQRVESDASSFFFGPHAASHPHRRSRLCNEVNFSATSNRLAPSIYSQSFGAHFQDDSSSIASPGSQSYAPQSSQVDHAARIRQHQVPSTDSILSDLSSARLDRPGISDKMFDRDYGIALSSISASPPGSTSSFSEQYDQRMRPDSLYSQESGQQMASSVDSLFGVPGRIPYGDDNDNVFDFAHSDAQQEAYERLRQFRPLSIISTSSTHTEPDENDTMISMLGGGHVRRRSIDSGLKYSPCNNVERKKNTALQHLARVLRFDEPSDELPSAPTIPDRLSDGFSFKAAQSTESFASRSSEHFEVERLTEEDVHQRPSLGESLFGATRSEEMLHPTQPSRATRPRSSTASSGAETPPLLTCDVSSASSGSQHSIDVGQLNELLNKASHPGADGSRTINARARPQGSGHRRRFSQIIASRTSIYETIEEESTILSSPQTFEIPTPPSTKGKVQVQPKASPPREPVIVVNSASGEAYQECWDPETGLVTMRRYSALREEAEETVIESKRVWHDTAFSVSSLQSFYPPKNKTGMRALLEHSKENYGPLPSELRPHRVRSRTSSRVSPYPIRPRVMSSQDQQHTNKPTVGMSFFSGIDPPSSTMALREISINPHFFDQPQIDTATLEAPPLPQFTLKKETAKSEKCSEEVARPRVSESSPLKPALALSKRARKTSNKSDKENAKKENTTKGVSMSSSGSLRLTRPRPRGSIPGRKVSQGA